MIGRIRAAALADTGFAALSGVVPGPLAAPVAVPVGNSSACLKSPKLVAA